MLIFSTKSRQKENFLPLKEGKVTIYVCGPTVYDDAHLGHAKSSISFDLLRRTFLMLGYKVFFVKNFTDIDDKILKKMEESGQSLEELTSFYIERFKSDMHELNVMDADVEPKATETLAEILAYIEKLLEKDCAYILEDGIYFDTAKDEKYLSLSGQRQNEDELQARVSSNKAKKNEKDFVLWKFDENYYPSPFGKGRPGWHTECVAMIDKNFQGDENFEIDIHAGGLDLLFPHHENEAAQCRCAKDKELAKYWMHNGFIQVDNEKMSKSLGNSFFVKDALKLVPGEALRFYLMSSHYRANFNYSLNDLLASKKRLDKLYRLKLRVRPHHIGEADAAFKEKVLAALSDDLNSSLALSFVDEMLNSANEYMDKNKKDQEYPSMIKANLEFLRELLGILYLSEEEYFKFGFSEEEKAEIEALILARKAAKEEKNYAKADEIRAELENKGVILMDLANSTTWEKKWEE